VRVRHSRHDSVAPSAGNPRLKSCSASRSRTAARTRSSTRQLLVRERWRCNWLETCSTARSAPVTSRRCASAVPVRTARTSTKMVDGSHHCNADRYVADHIAAQCSIDGSNDGVSMTVDMARMLAATSPGVRTITICNADRSVGQDGKVWLKRGSLSTNGRRGTRSARRRAAGAQAVGVDGPSNAPSHHRCFGGREVPSTGSSVARTSSFAAFTSRSSKNPRGFSGPAGMSCSPARYPARTNASASIDVPLRGAPAITIPETSGEVTC
jgi:hypothetical protein